MKTRLAKAGVALVAASLLLVGCSASRADAALDACKKAAEEQVGTSINLVDVEAANMGDALYDAGITDERDTDDANALFTAAGKFTYSEDGKEVRKSMICSVKFEDGQASAPELSIT